MARAVIVDRGWFRIQTDIKGLQNRRVDVGILPNAGSNQGVRIVDYAVFNEFGTATIPARPFMRKTADDSQKTLPAFMGFLITNLVNGKTTPVRVQHTLGQWYQARIRTTIGSARSWAAPNAPMTLSMKSHQSPLLDTYSMYNSINYKLS